MIMTAGEGTRTALAIPKQYYGDPAPLVILLDRLATTYPTLVVHGAHHGPWIDPLRDRYPHVMFCEGRETRPASVFAGLKALEKADFPGDATHVLIHDAARPYAPLGVFARVAQALAEGATAVCPVLSLPDTVCQSEGETWQATLDRSTIYRVQTPQGFERSALMTAFDRTAGDSFTDEGSRMHAAGYTVHLIPGSPDNVKITTEHDLRGPSRPQRERWVTGSGFDVHAFDPAKQTITLCGLCLPARQGLSGHSDADVALHALTDALLGTMALGDIGDHFPPTDPVWRGADSTLFLAFALQQLAEHNGVLEHIDLTLMGEFPKIAPHRHRYRDSLAKLCALSLNHVSVKATTTEKLGFLGREEGLAAQALVTVRF
jgi:2-C-methyl-D-erythritol 4-phosphate cytidylyltransferase/2-C-methyl-D-erythritol 2,4-cyclodiphosphate synthase